MQTRRIRIEWHADKKVTGLLAMPDRPAATALLLAHGAGAGQRHSFMEGLRRGLAAAGLPTLTFDYPFVEEGRRAPDKLPRLIETHRAAAERLLAYHDRIVIAGKSMGGRVGSHLVGEEGFPATAVVYFGYPLVPLGSRPPRPTDHLRAISVPQLFWAGTRDRLSPPSLIGPLVDDLADAALFVVDDADHGFHVPKRSGRTDADVIAQLAAGTANWLG